MRRATYEKWEEEYNADEEELERHRLPPPM
jgi:hypothetical protein